MLLWVAMITSAGNRRWPGDVVIDNLTIAGLPVPSVVRSSKIATIEARHAEKLGIIAVTELASVLSAVSANLRLP